MSADNPRPPVGSRIMRGLARVADVADAELRLHDLGDNTNMGELEAEERADVDAAIQYLVDLQEWYEAGS